MITLCLTLTSITSISAFAETLGTPDEDPVIANLRTRFEKGTEPKADYLKQNTFKCIESVARRGDFNQYPFSKPLRFEKFDGFMLVIQSDLDKSLYTFNGQELIGTIIVNSKSPIAYGAYRVDNNGFLISELTYVGAGPDSELTPISAGKGKVQTYTLCVPNN